MPLDDKSNAGGVKLDPEMIVLKGDADGAHFEIMLGGAIKIEVGGSVHVRTVREWHALAVAAFQSAIERSQVLHLLAVFRRARRHIEYRGAFTPHTEMLRQMDLQLEIFKGFDGLGPDVHDDI